MCHEAYSIGHYHYGTSDTVCHMRTTPSVCHEAQYFSVPTPSAHGAPEPGKKQDRTCIFSLPFQRKGRESAMTKRRVLGRITI